MIKKLKREYLLLYIDASFGGETPNWYLIGEDIESMAVELSSSVTMKKNILGQNKASDEGYEPSISADTYYANANDIIYPKLKDISLNRLTGDDCKTQILEVLIDKDGGTYDAWIEDCIIKPQSYGGDVTGVNIPFNIHYNGNRKQGTAEITNTVPVFTETVEGATNE